MSVFTASRTLRLICLCFSLLFVPISGGKLRQISRTTRYGAVCISLSALSFTMIPNLVLSSDGKYMDNQLYERILQEAQRESSPKVDDSQEMETVPNRLTKVTMADGTSSANEFEDILQLIPSYKYFKIIRKEYSSRSTNYEEGKENWFAPFQ